MTGEAPVRPPFEQSTCQSACPAPTFRGETPRIKCSFFLRFMARPVPPAGYPTPTGVGLLHGGPDHRDTDVRSGPAPAPPPAGL